MGGRVVRPDVDARALFPASLFDIEEHFRS